MKIILLSLLFLFIFIGNVFSLFAQKTEEIQKAEFTLQQRGEIYFSFRINGISSPKILKELGRYISFDSKKSNLVFAYANEKGFKQFLKSNLKFKVHTPPSMLLSRKIIDKKPSHTSNEWDYYPTYDQYVSLMNAFASDHPNLCELINIGQTVENRSLLFIHINDSLGVDRNEPELMFTATMHGNETTPYILMLHLIDYLLSNYGIDPQVTNLVNSIDIWINPLANPDGTYAGGNNTVYGATRFNGNNIDLNRNYPDPDKGPHPDGNRYQLETQDFMNFAERHNFVLSCNMHTGAEVANYPWDTWSRLHADDTWWVYVCRQYANTAQTYSPSGYFTDENNGITNGYNWYSISGGRQDYMNYYRHCKEFTLELSQVKMPPPSQMPDFWNYNYRSFLNYMQQALYGVRGLVTNKQNGNAIKAKVFVENHDADNSWIYTGLPVGNYHRPIKEGLYNFTFSALGYYPKTITNINSTDQNTLILNVQLQPYGANKADFYASDTLTSPDYALNFFDNSYEDSITNWLWSFEGGMPATSTEKNPTGVLYNEFGNYDVSLTITDTAGVQTTTIKTDYIHVKEAITMKNGSITTCNGLFYDSGGPSGNYANHEDYLLTFNPATTNSIIKIRFRQFDVEYENNCNFDYLTVYNGTDETAPLLGKFCGNEITKTFIGNKSGSLTFRFHSDENTNGKGWEAVVLCDTNLRIADKTTASFTVFPNPASGFVRISYAQIIDKLQVFDLTGKMYINKTNCGKAITLNTLNLPKGIYLLKAIAQNRNFTKKLIIK